MSSVEDFVYGYEGEQKVKEVLIYLHEFLVTQPEVVARIRYKIPFYYRKSWICYLNPLSKNTSVELSFIRANELSNDNGILNFKKRKQIAGIEFQSVQDFDENIINPILQEALWLDEKVKYNVRKGKSS